jgi:uncharacterized protein YbaR (Trm112 family)
MNPSTTILPCPRCRQRLRVPIDRGNLMLTCPRCRRRWDWSPRQEEVLYIDEIPTGLRDPGLARALSIYEDFERQLSESRANPSAVDDLWDEWLDGPRSGSR